MVDKPMTLAEAEKLLAKDRERARRSREKRKARKQEARRLVEEAKAKQGRK